MGHYRVVLLGRSRSAVAVFILLSTVLIGSVAWLVYGSASESETHDLGPALSRFESARNVPELELIDPGIERGDRGHAGEGAIPFPASASEEADGLPQPYVKPAPSLRALADSLREDLDSLREFRLFVTADRVVSKSVYLREDALGRSHAQPAPAALPVKDFQVTFSGANGTRVYAIDRSEYPLFAWFQDPANYKSEYGAQVDPELLERILALAEDSLALVP